VSDARPRVSTEFGVGQKRPVAAGGASPDGTETSEPLGGDALGNDAFLCEGPRVPRLGGARACVWLALALMIGGSAVPPRAPDDWQVTATGDGCALQPVDSGASCPCESLPATLRRVLALPLPLDRATRDDLELLPGIGPSRARAIVTAREQRGFDSVAELERVPGIGPKTVEALTPQLFVGAADPACATSPWIIRSAARRPD